MNKSNISAVVFDLGGVLIDIDYQRTIDAFKAIGVENASNLYNQFDQNMFFDQYEKGEISSEKFISTLEILTQRNIEKESIVRAWNEMIGLFPEEKLAFIHKIPYITIY